MALEDRQTLDTFVDEVHSLLRSVIFEHRDWLPDDLWQSYEAALSDLAQAVDETRNALFPDAGLDAPRFAEQLDADLAGAGLTGTQLNLKVSGWRRALSRFAQSPARRLLRRALRWGNVLLGSLAGVIGAAEALKEFKEAVEAGLEEEE